MADLFRKSSLEKLSNPEQLDRSIKITSPMSWLALLGVTLIIAATLIWSFVGTLPTTQTVSGVFVSTESTSALYSDYGGVVRRIYKRAGNTVKKGDDIIKIKTNDGKEKIIEANKSGKITKILVSGYTNIYPGAEIARLTPDISQEQVVVCFVPLAESKQIKKNMKVLLYPSSVDKQKYGHMEAKVHTIEEYPVTSDNLKYILGENNLVADQFMKNGSVISVICKIKTDSSTASGYYWTNKKGETLTITNGSLVSAKITIEECAPITKLFNNLKEKLEG